MKKLTESEEIVMKAVWDIADRPCLSDVLEKVCGHYGKDWKPQTVSTFLAKLCGKDFLRLQREGKVYNYEILVNERDYQKQKLKNLQSFIYNGDTEQLIADIRELF